MSTATKSKRPTSGRALREWSASAPSGAPLRVDRDAGVIYGVKVLGFHSRNSHGLKEATDGTEYTRRCMEQAIPLYEGVDVLVDHDERAPAKPTKRTSPKADDPRLFGALQNARVADDGIRADLHFFKDHAMAHRVCEDVERGLGRFGLSHDASAGTERFDAGKRRLVIESLAIVRSVDLVRKPATNRNLWESAEPMGTTLREMLDERRPKLSKPRQKWADRLLEDDTMAAGLDVPMDAPAETDPDAALKSGFDAACAAVLASDASADDKLKKLKELLKTHEKLAQKPEPEAPAEDPDPAPSDPDKTEAVKRLEHRLAVRDLCEELGVKGDKTLIEAAEALPMPAARKLLERERNRPSGAPRGSGAPGTGAGKPGKKPSGKDFLAAITD